MLKLAPPLTGRGEAMLARLTDLRNRLPLGDPNNPIWAWHRYGNVDWICSRFGVSPSDIIARHVDCVQRLHADTLYEVWARYALAGDEEATLAIFSKISTASGRIGIFPYYDKDFLKCAELIPWSMKMAKPENNFRKSIARSIGVPELIINRRKTGFGIRSDDWALEGGPFDPVARLAEDIVGREELRAVRSRDRADAMTFWGLINYALWKRICVNGESASDLAAEAGSDFPARTKSPIRTTAQAVARELGDAPTDGDSVVAVVQDKAAYCMTPPYDPSEAYPEYPFKKRMTGVVDNPAYRAVRQSLATLGLDAPRFGTAEWNPLRGIISPGGTVVIKPNLVLDRHYDGGDLYSIITHPSVVRAVADYCRIALGDSGNIIVADAPVEDCDFEHLLEETGLEQVVEVFRAAGGVSLSIRDLRRFQSPPGERGYSFKRRTLPGDPLGDVIFDLGERSALFGKTGSFYGADPGTKETAENHHGNIQRYCVSKTILACDTLISLPKLKVHKKVGVTLNLKGLVGINTNKNYLVHYTLGTPKSGGDETPDSPTLSDSTLLHARRLIIKTFFNRRYPIMEKLHDTLFHSTVYVAARTLLRKVGLRQSPQSSATDGGNWPGNDSCWRMVADLARIAFYGDSNGHLCSIPQRRLFSFVDGIIGGDLNGPLKPRARPSGVIIAGADPGAVDVVCTRVMGFDPLRLPLFQWLWKSGDHQLFPAVEKIRINGNAEAVKNHLLNPGRCLGFEPHKNWTGQLEIRTTRNEILAATRSEYLVSATNPVAPGRVVSTEGKTADRSLSAGQRAASPDPGSIQQTVAHVVLSLKVGGLERVVVNLVKGMQGSRYRNIVFCLDEPGEFAAELEELGIPLYVLHKKPGIHFRPILELARLFRLHKIDIVHTHNPAPHLHGLIAAFLSRTPVCIHTRHGRNAPDNARVVWLNRILSWRTDAIVPVSKDAEDVARNVEHINPLRLRQIWNGVDTDRYRILSQPESRGPIIGTVARLAPEKDYPTMLDAFRLVANQIPEARLVFVGDGPSSLELHAKTAELGLQDRVEFLGMRRDICELLNTFSIFSLSSTTEGLSMTVLEAMACGTPVVATDVGGNREMLYPPVCGLLAPAKNPVALAEAYLRLLRNPQERIQMAAAARHRVVQDFSVHSMLRQYLALYDEILAVNHR